MRSHKPKNIKVISIQVTPQKPNSVNDKDDIAFNKMKPFLIFGLLFGFSRSEVFSSRRIFKIVNVTYSALLIFITIYFGLKNRTNSSTSFNVVRDTSFIEFILLLFFSFFANKSMIRNFFTDVDKFDLSLNINNDASITIPMKRVCMWILISILLNTSEWSIINVFVPKFADDAFSWSYIALSATDYKHLLFSTSLRLIMNRVLILKTYVIRKFSSNSSEAGKKLSKVEALSNKAQLDIGSLHRNYELLHKCAEQLNSIMNMPMIIMLFCSGLSTTMLAKSLFKAVQVTNGDTTAVQATVIFCVYRCVKYTFLVIMPCYLSSITTTQVSHMRTILHDAMNTVKIDKVERRRVKAFFQLTRENEFAYALWGVIRLNMSLPLSYLSICTTYLVIIIQFSKFID